MSRALAIDEDTFRADWDAGLTYVEIAAKHGCTEATVYNLRKRYGCVTRRCGSRPYRDHVFDTSPNVLVNGEWVLGEDGIRRWVAA